MRAACHLQGRLRKQQCNSYFSPSVAGKLSSMKSVKVKRALVTEEERINIHPPGADWMADEDSPV